jgi:hypothetical protein
MYHTLKVFISGNAAVSGTYHIEFYDVDGKKYIVGMVRLIICFAYFHFFFNLWFVCFYSLACSRAFRFSRLGPITARKYDGEGTAATASTGRATVCNELILAFKNIHGRLGSDLFVKWLHLKNQSVWLSSVVLLRMLSLPIEWLKIWSVIPLLGRECMPMVVFIP